jgi:hypothetical protein
MPRAAVQPLPRPGRGVLHVLAAQPAYSGIWRQLAGDMRFLAEAMIIVAAVFIPAALLVLALGAGIGWGWASLGLLMATRASTLLARFASDRWVVLGARR